MSRSQIFKEAELIRTQDITDQLLPANAFTDPAVLSVEEKGIFAKTWVNIGYASQLPEVGDIRSVMVAGQPLIIVRDREIQLHVYHNVCRHRGFRLVDEKCSNARLIRCPYHAWSYDLDGALKAAGCWDGDIKQQAPSSVKEKASLLQVRSAIWNDMIFINLSGDAEEFGDFIAPLEERWKEYDLSRMYLANSKEYIAPGNWKLAIENFVDGYHFPAVHAKFGNYQVMLKFEHLRISENVFGYHMPTGEADKPKVGAPMPSLELPEHLMPAQDILYLYPNTLLILTGTWLQSINLLPVTPGETEENLALYLVDEKRDDPEVNTTREDFIAAANEINEQDMPVLDGLQKGMMSPGASRGMYVKFWDENPYLFHLRMKNELDYT